MKAVIYARYSCDNQREESIEGQLRECKEFAERKGMTLIGTYIDRAMSAKTDNRPEFQKMIGDSSKGLFDAVIVWKLDRFARNRYDSAHNKAMLRKNGVKVISATEVISDGAEGIILESVLEGYAEYYSAELSEKVIRGMTENALKCQFNGGVIPVGYTVDENKHFHIDPLTAPFVKDAFEMYSSGRMIKDIVIYLNENGVQSGYKKPMTKTSVTALLNNVKYKGQYKYRDILIDDGVPRIVSDELFQKTQERLEKNQRSRSRFKAKKEYFLSTKLICGDCGSFMIGESGTGRGNATYNYYKCTSVKRKLGCHKKSIRKDYIEEIVLHDVFNKMFSADMISDIADSVMRLQKKENTAVPLLKKELAEVEKGIDNLITAMQMGMLTKSTKKRLDELEVQKEQIELNIIKQEIQQNAITREQVIIWLQNMKQIDLASDDSKRKMVDTFVNSVYLYDDRVVISFNCREGASKIALPNGGVSDCVLLGEPNWINPNSEKGSDFFAFYPGKLVFALVVNI